MFVSVEFDQAEPKIMEDIIGKKEYLFVTRSTLEELTVLYGEKCAVCDGSINCIPEKYKNTLFVGYSSRTREAAINMLLDLVETASVTIRSSRTIVEFVKKMGVSCGNCTGTKNEQELQPVDPIIDPSSPETVPSIGREETLGSQGEHMEAEEHIQTVFSDVETATIKEEVIDPEDEVSENIHPPSSSQSSSRRSSATHSGQGNMKREEIVEYDDYMDKLAAIAAGENPFLPPPPPRRTSSLNEKKRAARGNTVTSTSSNSSAATPHLSVKVEFTEEEDPMSQLEAFVDGDDYQHQLSISSVEGELIIEVGDGEHPMEIQATEGRKEREEEQVISSHSSTLPLVPIDRQSTSNEFDKQNIECSKIVAGPSVPIKKETAVFITDPNGVFNQGSQFQYGYDAVNSTPAQPSMAFYNPQDQYNTVISPPQVKPAAVTTIAPVQNLPPQIQQNPLPSASTSLVQRVAPVQRPTPAFSPYANTKKLPVNKPNGKKQEKPVRMSCKECQRPIKAADGVDLQARINFSIISHVRIHMETLPFNCDLCVFKARHPAGIRHHIEKEHPQHPRNYFTDKSNTVEYCEETRAKARQCFPEWDIKI